MTTEIAITNFQLPGNVRPLPNGYILPPHNSGLYRFFSVVYDIFAIAGLIGLGFGIYRGNVIGIILGAVFTIVCFSIIIHLSFSTTLIFHVENRTIERQITSTFSCISPQITIFHFEGITRIIQQYGRFRALWLETSAGDKLNLSWWSHWETQPEWGTWLNRMGLNLPLRYEDTFR